MRRTTVRRGVAFAVALVALASMFLAGDEARAQTTVNVDVGDIYFCDPSFANGICETNVAVGDTVQWNWVGGLPHTVTQCDTAFTTCPPSGGFDSGILTGAGQTFSETFNTPGTFPYQCNVHGAQMRGRVIVAAQGTTTPTGGATAPAQTGTPAPAGTTAPGATATRTAGPAATTAATPAGVPGTGGDSGDAGFAWPLALALAGSVLLIASAGVGVAVARRR